MLRAGYLDILPAMVSQKQANEAARPARDTAPARAAALFEVPAPEDGTLALYPARPSAPTGTARGGVTCPGIAAGWKTS